MDDFNTKLARAAKRRKEKLRAQYAAWKPKKGRKSMTAFSKLFGMSGARMRYLLTKD